MQKSLLASGLLAAHLLPCMPAALAGTVNVVLPMPASPVYVKECGSCHTAYAPTYLPARSWRKLMLNLDQHFDEDASLAPADRDLLLSQLEALAGDRANGAPPISQHNNRVPASQTPIRVTEMPFFGFMHDEVPKSVWARPRIGSKANCIACHGKADQGSYFEREIRIPK